MHKSLLWFCRNSEFHCGDRMVAVQIETILFFQLRSKFVLTEGLKPVVSGNFEFQSSEKNKHSLGFSDNEDED